MTKPGYRLRLPWLGVRTQLFALVVLPLSVLTMVIAFGGLSLHRTAMRTLVGDRDERVVRAAASAVVEQLNHRIKAVQGLALLVGEAARPEEALQATDYLLGDFDFGMAVFSRTGTLLSSIGDLPFWESLSSGLPQLEDALRRDAPPAFVTLAHPETGEPVILVLAAGQKGGPVAAGAFDPAGVVSRTLAGIFNTDLGGVSYLVDSAGTVLYHAGNPAPDWNADHPGIAEALAGESGTTYFQGASGEHVVSYSPISPPGWALVIEEPWEGVTSPLLRATEYAPFVLAPAFLLALLALWFGARQIVLPLQTLATRAADLGRGRFEPIEKPVGGIAEIQDLQGELIELAHKVRSSQSGLRGYIGAITTGQEEERHRLARELHDETLQSLIALNQRIQLARLSANDPRTTASLEEVQRLAGQTITELRRITRALRPIYLEDLGMISALEMLARETTELTGIPVAFQQTGDPRRLNEQTELALYRIVQEALNNVAHHSGANQAYLRLDFLEDLVHLSIEDNGQGFDPPESPTELAPQGHFGLLSIQERADLIAARLEITSSSGRGTKIMVTCPFKPARSE